MQVIKRLIKEKCKKKKQQQKNSTFWINHDMYSEYKIENIYNQVIGNGSCEPLVNC